MGGGCGGGGWRWTTHGVDERHEGELLGPLARVGRGEDEVQPDAEAPREGEEQEAAGKRAGSAGGRLSRLASLVSEGSGPRRRVRCKCSGGSRVVCDTYVAAGRAWR